METIINYVSFQTSVSVEKIQELLSQINAENVSIMPGIKAVVTERVRTQPPIPAWGDSSIDSEDKFFAGTFGQFEKEERSPELQKIDEMIARLHTEAVICAQLGIPVNFTNEIIERENVSRAGR